VRLLLGFVLGSFILPVGALVAAVEFNVWPSDWEAGEQAALIAALIGALIPIYGAGAKALYDEISARSAHDRRISELLFGGYEEYSRAIIYPLLATSGDLLAALKWDLNGANEETKNQVLYEVCRYTECVSRLRSRYSRAPQVPQRGLFLSSPEIEDIIWALMVEPWVLGVPGALGEAVGNEAIRDEDGTLLPISRFAVDTEPSDFRYLKEAVLDALSDDKIRALISDCLFALNAALDWATVVVLKPWYRSTPGFPKTVLDPLTKAPEELRTRIALAIPDVSKFT
jgi:hypothetical protein